MSQHFFGAMRLHANLALREAERAPAHHDVPIGAVLVRAGEVLAALTTSASGDEYPTGPTPRDRRWSGAAPRGAAGWCGAVSTSRSSRVPCARGRCPGEGRRGVSFTGTRSEGSEPRKRPRCARRAPPEPCPRSSGVLLAGERGALVERLSGPQVGSAESRLGTARAVGLARPFQTTIRESEGETRVSAQSWNTLEHVVVDAVQAIGEWRWSADRQHEVQRHQRNRQQLGAVVVEARRSSAETPVGGREGRSSAGARSGSHCPLNRNSGSCQSGSRDRAAAWLRIRLISSSAPAGPGGGGCFRRRSGRTSTLEAGCMGIWNHEAAPLGKSFTAASSRACISLSERPSGHSEGLRPNRYQVR